METIDKKPFLVIEAKVPVVPIVISIPHCGTDFPEEISEDYISEKRQQPDDTDWFLDQLYSFAPDLGITIVRAKYSRWVIDLNRDPESAPLYTDGRIITGLTTDTDFLGKPIYKEGKAPNQKEIERRLEHYYWPYYRKVQELLDERISEFGNVILWDAHSIRSFVPTIRSERFPEMILGTADEKSADIRLIQSTLKTLRKKYQVNHNDPFKGGHITRYFGNPEKHIHGLQLERNKDLYMNEQTTVYDPEKGRAMAAVLKENFLNLIDTVKNL